MIVGDYANSTTPFRLDSHRRGQISKAITDSALLSPVGLDGVIMGELFCVCIE